MDPPSARREAEAVEGLSAGYLAIVLGLMVILPIATFAVERLRATGTDDSWETLFRWFIFWGIGVRLLVAGVRQIVQPSFTSREIFHLSSADAEVVVRELGFANVCMGLAATATGFVPSWRPCAAFTGGLYFGIAGAMHAIKRPATPNEWVALTSDLFIFGVAAVYFARELL
jgi:hypothetical protein